jgi:HD-GYP domain-containing protein (c-di-GMP phosphodiesterase class II)
MNGRGYPDGLKGEEMPIIAKIVAVADTYDAMTTDRPYRKALSKEVAMGELKRCAGVQFDRHVVEAFVKAYESGEI